VAPRVYPVYFLDQVVAPTVVEVAVVVQSGQSVRTALVLEFSVRRDEHSSDTLAVLRRSDMEVGCSWRAANRLT